MRTPGPLAGALCGALITTAVLAVLYLLYAAFGLPFLPFQVFDLVSRLLPGGLVTFGIDAMVAVIRRLNIGETSTVAKIAEQGLAIAGMLITGVLAAALFFVLRRHGGYGKWLRTGVVAGLVLGLPSAAVAASSTQQEAGGPMVSAIWALVAWLSWGLAIAWAHNRLQRAAAPAGMVQDAEVVRLDRRSFMLRLAGATATITVAGAVITASTSTRSRPRWTSAAGASKWTASCSDRSF